MIHWGWMRGLKESSIKKASQTSRQLLESGRFCYSLCKSAAYLQRKTLCDWHCDQKFAQNLVSWNGWLNRLFAVVFTCQLSWEKCAGLWVWWFEEEQLEDFWKPTLPKDYGVICVWRRNERVYLLQEWFILDFFFHLPCWVTVSEHPPCVWVSKWILAY